MKKSFLIENRKRQYRTSEKGETITQPDLSLSCREIIARATLGKQVNTNLMQSIDDPELDEDRQLSLQIFEDKFEAMDYVKQIDSFKKRFRQCKANELRFSEKLKEEEEKKRNTHENTANKIKKTEERSDDNS